MQRVATVPCDFVEVTETSGDAVAVEQIERHARRYYWAGEYCRGKDVLEIGSGAGQGLGYLQRLARSVTAGDYSAALLSMAQKHYGRRARLQRFDAHHLPFATNTFDVVLIFEALYYIRNIDQCLVECRRVLRPGGMLLIATANKDLFDFNPSPHSTRYLGVVELVDTLAQHGYAAECFGDTPIDAVSWRQRVLRPLKALGAALRLIPKTMHGKKLLKRLVFGRLAVMPPEITPDMAARMPATPLRVGAPDRRHKVILCAAGLPR
jgi:SAM-dependent methyltransferase